MHGAVFVTERQDDEIGDALAPLRRAGELADYSDEELMTVNLICIWQKPLEWSTGRKPSVLKDEKARRIAAESPSISLHS
jgi:hypothetical protein